MLMQTSSKYCKAISPFSSGAKLFVGNNGDNYEEDCNEYNKQVKPNFYALGEGVIAISSFRKTNANSQKYIVQSTLMTYAQFII